MTGGPFVTVSGVPVDASLMIDALVAKIAELALENASLRAQVGTWSALAQSQVVDGVPDPPDASESPIEVSQGGSLASPWPR